jgi:signal peptidase II
MNAMSLSQQQVPECGPPSGDHDTCVTHRVKTLYVLFWMAFTDALLLDGVLKWLISQQPEGFLVALVPDVIEVYHLENNGVAFGLMGGTAAPVWMGGLLLVALAFWMLRQPLRTKAQAWGLALLLGGGLNNWLDRAFTQGVTDYISLSFLHFPVFNLSDVFVFVGSSLLGWILLQDILSPVSKEPPTL